MLVDTIFLDVGIIIVVGTFFAYIAKVFKQPLVPAYVITGLLLGPILHVITNQSIIATLSEMGIAFLLFIVGLELDLSKLKSVGLVAGVGGLAQSLLLFTLGFLTMVFFGFSATQASYLGLVIAFSSTMVVIKILSDKRELDTLHGRLVIGYLLMQDLLAIVAISVLSNLNGFNFMSAIELVVKGAVFFFLAVVLNKQIFPKLFKFIAKSQELLFLSAISVCFMFSMYGVLLGLSVSIGAFIAGVTLANLPYTFEMIGKVRSMRDFFATIFFVSLGISIIGISNQLLIVTITLIVLVLFIKPWIIFFLTTFFGYKSRPSFLTGLSLAQTSEFGLIIATQGLLLGHLGQDLFSMIAIIVVITMSVTPYFINYEYTIYTKMKQFLKRFDHFADGMQLEFGKKSKKYDVLLVGYDRIGYSILKKLHILKKKILVVDYNPDIIKRLVEQKIHCIYGDIADTEILERIRLRHLSLVISTSANKNDNELLISRVRAHNKNVSVFVTAYNTEDALALYDDGADYVILPHFLGGDHVSLLIEEFGDDLDKLLNHKISHIAELRHRNSLGHDRHARH